MKRTEYHQIGKWKIEFTRNIHMYCHRLLVRKGKHNINIPCEDLPEKDKKVGIWIYDLDTTQKQNEELETILLRWADEKKICIKLYVSKDNYVLSSCCLDRKLMELE